MTIDFKSVYSQIIIGLSVFLLSIYLAFKLSGLEKLEVFKLFNVIGISFDILGLLMLSYVTLANQRTKELLTSFVVSVVVEILVFFPLGLLIGVAIAEEFMGLNNTQNIFVYAVPIIVAPFIAFLFLEDSVRKPLIKYKSPDTKVKILGGVLLIFGLIIQLYASILDLVGE